MKVDEQMLTLLDHSVIRRSRFLLEDGYHPEWALFLVDEGAFRFEMEGQVCVAGAKDVVVFPKGTHFKRQVTEPLTCHYLQFRLRENSLDLPRGKLAVLDQERLVSTCRNLRRLSSRADKVSKQLAEHFLCDILYQVYAENHMKFVFDKAAVEDGDIVRIIDYFKQNLRGKINLRTLAREAGLTQAGLIWKFKKETSVTPAGYLISLRLAKAKELLLNTNLSVAAVAEECGYANAYYFSNAFKKQTGLSPARYRISCRV